MRESIIEYRLVNQSNKILNAVCWKWKSTRRGVPDRILLKPIAEEHRAIVAKYVRLVETKAPDGEPSAQQRQVHRILRDMGYRVDVLSTPEMVDRLVEELKA